jgi:hypothetical protein
MIVTFLHWELYVGYIRLESFGGLENDFAWRKYLTLILLTWRKWLAPNNAIK